MYGRSRRARDEDGLGCGKLWTNDMIKSKANDGDEGWEVGNTFIGRPGRARNQDGLGSGTSWTKDMIKRRQWHVL